MTNDLCCWWGCFVFTDALFHDCQDTTKFMLTEICHQKTTPLVRFCWTASCSLIFNEMFWFPFVSQQNKQRWQFTNILLAAGELHTALELLMYAWCGVTIYRKLLFISVDDSITIGCHYSTASWCGQYNHWQGFSYVFHLNVDMSKCIN